MQWKASRLTTGLCLSCLPRHAHGVRPPKADLSLSELLIPNCVWKSCQSPSQIQGMVNEVSTPFRSRNWRSGFYPTQQSIMPQVKLERTPIFCCSPLTPSVLTVSPEAPCLPLPTPLDLSPWTWDKRRQGIRQSETWGFQEAKEMSRNLCCKRHAFNVEVLISEAISLVWHRILTNVFICYPSQS